MRTVMKRALSGALCAALCGPAATAGGPERAPADERVADAVPTVAAAGVAGATAQTRRAQRIEDVTVYKVAKVLTMDEGERVVNNAAVVVRNGKIDWVGKAKDLAEYPGAVVVERPDLWLVPGLIELHNHTAGDLSDLNDMVYLTNPGLRSADTVVPDTFEVERAQQGGVTAALLIPGSGTNMSGFGTAVKFAGDSVAEVIVRSPGSIKIAQAGNPEWYWTGVGRSFMNFNTRQTLEGARDYHLAWEAFERGESDDEPAFDPVFDDFRGLFRRDFPASVHTQGYQLVMTTVDMLARKLNIKVVLDHSTFDGWKVAPLVLDMGEDNVITMVGPRGMYFDFTQRKIHGNVSRWYDGGVRKLGMNTDSPVIPQEELVYQATMAAHYGLPREAALKGLTSVAAEALQVDDRMGTIEVGKDADFCLWTGDPLDPRSHVELTVVNGEVAHDAQKEGRRF